MSGEIDNFRAENDMCKTAIPPEIGLVLYPGVQMASALGMTDMLNFAEYAAAKKQPTRNEPLLRISHWQSKAPGKMPSRIFATSETQEELPTVLVLPPSLSEPLSSDAASGYARWLRTCHDKGIALASICAGAFVLGETGLLSGRPVTTHWMYGETFAQRFPDASLNIDRLVIDDGDIITAGGVMAWVDLSLKMIDRYLGPTIMQETARTFLVDPSGREQSYYSAFSPKLNHGDEAVLKLQHWLQTTKAKKADLSVLARRAGLQQRTLLRRFQKATGLTTSEYVQRLRVGQAQELLQFSDRSVDTIAWEVGYADPGAFRKVFSKVVGLTPSSYRRRFRPSQRVATTSEHTTE